MSTATETKGKAMKTRRYLTALALSLTGLFATAAVAQAEATSQPAWKVLAASGPTHLPPRQSEVQRVTVQAAGGTFTLSGKAGEGTGTPVTTEGHLTYSEGNTTATIESVEAGASFEVGLRLQGSRIPSGTTIVSCSADCETPGTTVELSDAPTGNKTNQKITIFTRELSGVSGEFFVGDEIASGYLDPGAVVEAVSGATITLSQPTNSSYFTFYGAISLSATEPTAPIPYSASGGEVQEALESMPYFQPPEPGRYTVTGGPGGDAATPYYIHYGAALAGEEVEELGLDGSGLSGEGAYARSFTTVPGGPGTGTIWVAPVNIGGAPTGGAITLHLGPLPAGVVIDGAVETTEPEASGWSCTTEPSEATCTTSETIKKISPGPQIKVPVKVEPTVASSSQATVTVSGGGAAGEASYALPIVISSEPAQAGVAAFLSGSFEADGTPSTQAGGHPYSQFTAVVFNTVRSGLGWINPAGDLRDLNVDLPPGFLGDPLVTDRCPQGYLVPETGGAGPACNTEGQFTVGTSYVGPRRFGSVARTEGSGKFSIVNDVPAGGTAAQFSTRFVVPVVTLLGSVRSEEDFGVRIASPNSPTSETVYSAFTFFQGEPEGAEGKAFLRNATDCAEQARRTPAVDIAVNSWQNPSQFDHASSPQPPVTGCDKLKFEPQFSFQPTNTDGSSGTGATAHLHIDQSGLTDPERLRTPDLKQSVVKLPEGLNVNPSQANGLQACSEAQVGYKGAGDLPNPTRFNNDPVSCPDASKLGTVEATTPLLEEPLKGTIYLAAQEENPFDSLIGLYLVIESPRFGITLKLPGKVDVDPDTGQLTATFDYVPQQPVEDLTLTFRGGGPRSTLATPEVCGTYATKGAWTPWSAPESGPAAQTSNSFNVSNNCASSSGARPFNPSFEAGSTDPIAGGYSPLVVKVDRADGEQELRSLDFTMPPGLAAKLAGVPYCSDADIAAAQGKSGKDEQSSPSCPEASKLGTIDAAAGVGSEPVHVGGSLYLAGPYKGAPLSAVAITPAVAGPFDLGDVVIRTPLRIDPVTAQVTASSDEFPTALRGIPLKLRSVAIKIDKGQFALNPTNCEAMKITASLGSSNGATASPENRFQVGGCKELDFKPHMRLTLKGGTKRTAHPKLIADVFSKGIGVAGLARIQTKLPRSAFLDNAHIKTICTRVQFAAGNGNGEKCPKGSVYGKAWVKSPLFDYWLSGNVYLRSSNHKLPDLVLAIQGPASQPIAVELAGKTDSVRGALRNTFEGVPDAPFTKARLVLFGGKRGLVVNSRNLCRQSKRDSRANVRLSGQNGKVSQLHPIVRNDCGKAAKKKHKRHHRRHNG